jgi:hypothetical protein
MKSRVHFFLLAAIALVLQGCNIKWQTVQDPYPNYHLIERRIQSQSEQIDRAVSDGYLNPPMAQALADNVEFIRKTAWEYQNNTGAQIADLTPAQTRFLGILLNDNAMAINDAMTRTNRWASAFGGAWNFDFTYRPDRMLYIAYLHHQLEEQQAMVEDGLNQGYLNPSQAADLRSRIQVIRETEWDDYDQNQSLDLSRDQMEELAQMVDDNYRYIRFRSQFARTKPWKGDRFDSWGQYRQDFQVSTTNNFYTAPNTSMPTQYKKYWDGRPIKPQAPAPTATPVPYVQPAVPTRTPTPYVAPAAPTATPVPQAPKPTATPVPAAPAATATPKPPRPTPVYRHHDNNGQRRHGNGNKDDDQNDQGSKNEDQGDKGNQPVKTDGDQKDKGGDQTQGNDPKDKGDDSKDKKVDSSDNNDQGVQGDDHQDNGKHNGRNRGRHQDDQDH